MKTRFLVALTVTVLMGLAVIAANGLLGRLSSTPPVRPTISPTAGYRILFGSSEATLVPLVIAADGTGCEKMEISRYLYRACLLATNLDAQVIAGEAFGRINFEPTPAREALIWRAVLNGESTFCAAGGLIGDLLTECTSSVTARFRRATGSGQIVEVRTPESQ